MGSRYIQGKLWGQKPEDWAIIQEPTGNSGYMHALESLKLQPNQSLLDIGCGTGYFCNIAFKHSIAISGLDASEQLIHLAKKRNPRINYLVGEMEDLPFTNNSFDVICGFNSFQYAENIDSALLESKRVLKNNGKLVVMIWGNKEDCEAASCINALGSLLPPNPSSAKGPFSFSENQLLEKTLQNVGFNIVSNNDIESVWQYPNTEIALKGLLSAGPAAKAIEHSGFKKVYETMKIAIKPFTLANRKVVYNNKWRVVICEKIK